jgi:hypothetical protein
VDKVASQPVRIGDVDAVEGRQGSPVSQAVEAGPPRGSPAVAVVAEHVLLGELFALVGKVNAQAFNLLLDGLRLDLTLSRDADVDRDPHETPSRE